MTKELSNDTVSLSRLLFVGNFFDGTGWSQAANDYALAMDAAGIDVVCRPIFLSQGRHDAPPRIRELIDKDASGCELAIQYTLPHEMAFDGNFVNIGLFDSETSHFNNTCWADRLNCMDAVCVTSNAGLLACVRSGVNRSISLFPHCVNTQKFQRSYRGLAQLETLKKRGEFIFYYIGEHTSRKNLSALLKGFFLEFDIGEPVRLVLKASTPGLSPDASRVRLQQEIDVVRRGLKLSSYKDVILITERLTEEALYGLHQQADCFVTTSHGEACCLSALDAMGFGKTPIAPNGSGFSTYFSEDGAFAVKCYEEPCFDALDTFPDLYVGNENWLHIDITSLRARMREAYEQREAKETKVVAGIRRVYEQFSYEAIGALARELLQKHVATTA